MNIIADQQQRQQALNPEQSFIVQAPAGSGKTELLTQRFLKLLVTVDKNPEEVLAITFTRKAANEMRQRILSALHLATQEKPTLAHKENTWKLAKQVLHRDTEENWQLLSNPNRLRIQTIDSLCTYLGKQLPISSGLGSSVNIVEDAQADYQQAVEAVLANLEDDVPWATAIATLLLHLDNNLTLVKKLLVNMLTHRDQWLPHVVKARNNSMLREHLEASLANLIHDTLLQLTATFPKEQQQESLELLTHAAARLENSTNSVFASYQPCISFPEDTLDDLQHWPALATLFLTQKYEWRKAFDKRIGFPITANNKEEKIRLRTFKERITVLAANLSDNIPLQLLLKEVLLLPPSQYDDTQWKILTALLELLPLIVAQLNINFRRAGHIDFIETTQRALQALEHEDAPTDLALALDYKMKHILVDEFQDTSVTQFHLLQLLTKGWQAQDGRTLFLVGDPMQSIYRFRAAEVGLFLQAKQYGIGDIKLNALTLTTNFRSTTTITNWFNRVFQNAFAQKNDIALGAISYSPATAIEKYDTNEGIYLYQCDIDNPRHEANTIVNIIQKCQKQDPKQTIAILVKTRRQLLDILPVLKNENIEFNAVDIENLGHLPAIQDLTALTLALQHFGNRLAWLSILRAPWCGLTLADLHCIASNDISATIWQRITDSNVIQTLSQDGQQRLHVFTNRLAPQLQQRGRFALKEWVYTTWLILQGPATLSNNNNLDDCNTFFSLLEKMEITDALEKTGNLETALDKLYALGKNSSQLQIMTIHKAKGLEFDTVIIPSLETASASDRARLLLWQERPNNNKEIDLLLAPIKARKDDNDPIHEYIRTFEQRKHAYENMRLFYVAITRSKQQLHLLANISTEETKPRSNSFLHTIWEEQQNNFKEYYKNQTSTEPQQQGNLKRFSDNTKTSETLKELTSKDSIVSTNKDNTPQWQSFTQRGIGIVIHFILQQLNNLPLFQWENLFGRTNAYQILLREQGVPLAEMATAVQMITTSLNNLLVSKRAQWLFSPLHSDIHAEYALCYKNADTIKQLIIDRTFIADGTRWIVDYKIIQPIQEQSVEEFLKDEKRHHQQQLEAYGTAFSQLDTNPIKLGLFFPLIDSWIEWDYQKTN